MSDGITDMYRETATSAQQPQTHDPVNHPKHYCHSPSGIEVIQITEHMNFCLGNAVKYIMRCDYKGSPIQDLKKAIWYIEREIELRARCLQEQPEDQ